MHLIYIDDSYDQDAGVYTFSAVVVSAEEWRNVFEELKSFRRRIRDSDGIYVTKELHAWKFVSGRGHIAPTVVTKFRRCQIFRDALTHLARQRVSLFNVVLRSQDWAFERILNRVNRTMRAWNSHALLICDQGKEADYTRLVRKMGVHNPIPSRYEVWRDTGNLTKNIPIDRIIEDPFFKASERSYFIQMADFCAYALLRREVQIVAKNLYNLHTAFDLLRPICFTGANVRDPMGVIR